MMLLTHMQVSPTEAPATVPVKVVYASTDAVAAGSGGGDGIAGFERRYSEMSRMEHGWDGPQSKAPSLPVLNMAYRLGKEILRQTRPPMKHLNMSAGRDGSILFTLFGKNGREAELWVEDGAGEFRYVCEAPELADDLEGSMPIGRFGIMSRWLTGKGKLI